MSYLSLSLCYLFSLIVLRFSSSLILNNMPWSSFCSFVFMSCVRRLSSILNLCIYSFHQIWRKLTNISLNIFPVPRPQLIFKIFNHFQISCIPLIRLFQSFLCVPYWVVSFAMSSRSLVFASKMFICQ